MLPGLAFVDAWKYAMLKPDEIVHYFGWEEENSIHPGGRECAGVCRVAVMGLNVYCMLT